MLEPPPHFWLEGVMERGKCRLLVGLIRSALHESDKPDLRAMLWQWLALRVVRLGWHRRLFGLTGYRFKMIKHYGRLNALDYLQDDDAEESQQRVPPRRHRPRPKSGAARG